MSPEIDRSGTPILPARGLLKRYGHVTAIDGADFDLYPARSSPSSATTAPASRA